MARKPESVKILLSEQAFDIGKLFDDFTASDTGIGGVCMFSGLVRDFNDGREIRTLSLEHYPSMAEKQLGAIADNSMERFALRRLWVLHRYGDLSPGDVIVVVLAAAEHRAEAFDGCRFVMDYLKTEAPFWKMEQLTDGNSARVAEREADKRAVRKWED